jgi:hypothetical protein
MVCAAFKRAASNRRFDMRKQIFATLAMGALVGLMLVGCQPKSDTPDVPTDATVKTDVKASPTTPPPAPVAPTSDTTKPDDTKTK